MSEVIANPPQPGAARPTRDWLAPWHVNPSLNKDYDFLDGLRGLAILAVVACHVVYFNSQTNPVLKWIERSVAAGSSGVTVFFALSGFLIAHPFWRRKIQGEARAVPRGYFGRRFWKIYPPLALSVAVFTPIYVWHHHHPALWTTALEWLTGVAWFVPVDGTLNPAMWSLVVEVHFYLTLPLLFLALKRASPKATLWTIFGGLLIGPTAFRWWLASRGIEFSIHPYINVHFPSLLDAFAFGVLVAGMENYGLLKKSWARLGHVGLATYFVALPVFGWFTVHPVCSMALQTEIFMAAVKLSAALMLCYVAEAQSPRTRWLALPGLRWLGIISYEWYLLHQPVLAWFRDWTGEAGGNLTRFAAINGAGVLISLTLAAVLYRFFSLPILKRGRSRNLVR